MKSILRNFKLMWKNEVVAEVRSGVLYNYSEDVCRNPLYLARSMEGVNNYLKNLVSVKEDDYQGVDFEELVRLELLDSRGTKKGSYSWLKFPHNEDSWEKVKELIK